jgi:hypothetical protein
LAVAAAASWLLPADAVGHVPARNAPPLLTEDGRLRPERRMPERMSAAAVEAAAAAAPAPATHASVDYAAPRALGADFDLSTLHAGDVLPAGVVGKLATQEEEFAAAANDWGLSEEPPTAAPAWMVAAYEGGHVEADGLVIPPASLLQEYSLEAKNMTPRTRGLQSTCSPDTPDGVWSGRWVRRGVWSVTTGVVCVRTAFSGRPLLAGLTRFHSLPRASTRFALHSRVVCTFAMQPAGHDVLRCVLDRRLSLVRPRARF